MCVQVAEKLAYLQKTKTLASVAARASGSRCLRNPAQNILLRGYHYAGGPFIIHYGADDSFAPSAGTWRIAWRVFPGGVDFTVQEKTLYPDEQHDATFSLICGSTLRKTRFSGYLLRLYISALNREKLEAGSAGISLLHLYGEMVTSFSGRAQYQPWAELWYLY